LLSNYLGCPLVWATGARRSRGFILIATSRFLILKDAHKPQHAKPKHRAALQWVHRPDFEWLVVHSAKPTVQNTQAGLQSFWIHIYQGAILNTGVESLLSAIAVMRFSGVVVYR
jgi:hypothetical protein